MKIEELKYKQSVFEYTDIQMKKCIIKGFTSDRIWILNSDGDLLQFDRKYAMRTYGVLYENRDKNKKTKYNH